MKFFHRTTAQNADSILKASFRDASKEMPDGLPPITGDWVSEIIWDDNQGARRDTVLKIEIKVSKSDLDFCEIKEKGKPCREWCFPAQLLNQGKITKL
jgi:hypothetical protein